MNTALPAISGTAERRRDADRRATARGTGTAPITYAYQWRRCDSDGANCADIAGATGSTYDLVAADVGHAMRVRVTATNAAGSVTADSRPTARSRRPRRPTRRRR